MNSQSVPHILLALAVVSNSFAADSLEFEKGSDAPVSLCQALQQTLPGGHREIMVSGIYTVSFEFAILYDPQEPLCEMDVQPATSVRFADGLRLDPALDEILATDKRAYVTFRGVLLGPKPFGEDDTSLPPMVAYAGRIANRRYGHLNSFRTELVVDEIVGFRRVPAALASYGEFSRSRLPSAPPVVVSAQIPRYPLAAQRVGLEGTVTLDLTVKNGRIVTTEVRSGDRILLGAAVENIETWTFEPDVEVVFSTTFVFKLEQRVTGADRNSYLDLRLPTRVTITAAADHW